MTKIPASMHAAVLHAAGDLRYEEVPVPQPQPDEVLVRVRMNGICGSDIHFFERGQLGPFRVTEPYIPGHEACGVVVEPASTVGGPAVGQRVAIEPGIPCRRCEFCKSGRYNLCPDVVFMSAPPVDGTFAEYVALAADFAHPVPDSVSDEEAAFIEPISVGVQACSRAQLKAGDTIAVLGSGPIGLVTLLVARAYGATEAFAVDLLENRLELAESLGARPIDASSTDTVAAIEELTNGRGVDVVFDTSGSAAACRITPYLARRGGVVTVVGWPKTATVDYPVEVVLEKELDVRGVNRYANTYPTAIGLLASGRLNVTPLISHRFAFEDVVEAFEFATDHPSETIKVMVVNPE
ncbi:MAG: NAD(P)-dependent alcohol dehydrogenase [Anaerolineae bacterium]